MRGSGHRRCSPERTKLAAVLAAVKVGLEALVGEGSVGVPADLDGVCARAAAVIRGRGGGRACGAVEQRNGLKRWAGWAQSLVLSSGQARAIAQGRARAG